MHIFWKLSFSEYFIVLLTKYQLFLYNRFQLFNPKKEKMLPWGGPTGWTFWLAQGEVIGWVRIFSIATDHQMIDLHSKQTVAHYKLLNIVSFFSFNDHGIRATPRVNPL